jgi:hypothetical protein
MIASLTEKKIKVHSIQEGVVVSAVVSGDVYFAFDAICQRLGASMFNVYREAGRQVRSGLFQSRVQEIYQMDLYTRLGPLLWRCRYKE